MTTKQIDIITAISVWLCSLVIILIGASITCNTSETNNVSYITYTEVSLSVDDTCKETKVKDIPILDELYELIECQNPITNDQEVETLSDFYYYEYYYDTQSGRYEKVAMDEQYQLYLYDCCTEYGIEYELVLALMGAESGFNVNYGVSPSGLYYGPGMLRIDYVVDELKESGIYLFCPEGAIEATCYILANKFETFNGRLHRSLMAYNMGDNGMRTYMRTTKNLTSGYSRRVVSIRDGLMQWRESQSIDI